MNKHIWKQSVKFDDIRIALMYIRKSSWCFKFDIHSAYHHLDIFPEHRKFLGFSWKFEGKLRYFHFNVLPFGMTSAPYIFTKLTRPLIAKWRGEGKNVLMYLDDGFCCHTDFNTSCLWSTEVKQDLISSGFVPKVGKSMWTPVQNLPFLGIDINNDSGTFSITRMRIEQALHIIRY